MTQNVNMQCVQDAFVKEINERGLAHVLQWIGVWYDRAAEAEVADDLATVLREHAADPEARELHLLDRLLPMAESITNYSTSLGHNVYRQALVGARSKELNTLMSMDGKDAPNVGRTARRNRWEAWRAKTFPAQSTPSAKT